MIVVQQAAGGGSVTLYDYEPSPTRLLDDVLAGLAGPRKVLPPKYFYDEVGAKLFERICELAEYYPTRTETGILQRHIPDIAAALGSGFRLVEFGSGSGIKTRILLENLRRLKAYIPVDISREQLLHYAISVSEQFPALEVVPVCADYTAEWMLPDPQGPRPRTVAFYPGSTIGNFERHDAEAFLTRVDRLCGPDGGLLVGVDLKKEPSIIERAYNDTAGVTAAFNLNLLTRINRECGADFDLDGFIHHAPYDEANGRIEMRLVSRYAQTVRIGGDGSGGPLLVVDFAPGEQIVTEYSHKYAPAEFAALSARAGWQVEEMWTDEREWFGVYLLTRLR
jgi:dimethylhistidine N-methyltransferase